MVNMYGAGKAYSLNYLRNTAVTTQVRRSIAPPPMPCGPMFGPTNITIKTTPGGFLGFMMGMNSGLALGNMAMGSLGGILSSVGGLIGNNRVGNALYRAGIGMGGGCGMSCPTFGGYGMSFPTFGGFGMTSPGFGCFGSYPSFGSYGMGYPGLTGGLYSGIGGLGMGTMMGPREQQGADEIAQQKQDAQNLQKLNGLFKGAGYNIIAEGNGKFSATDKTGKNLISNLTYDEMKARLGGAAAASVVDDEESVQQQPV